MARLAEFGIEEELGRNFQIVKKIKLKTNYIVAY